MTQPIEMFFDDPELNRILAIPLKSDKPKVHNPFFMATELEREGKTKEAERIYLELLNIDFDNAAVLAALGMNYAVNSKNGLAFNLLERAHERLSKLMEDFIKLGIIPKNHGPADKEQFLNVKKAEILNALGTCHKHENRTVESRTLFEQAQALVPINADIQNNLGTLHINEGDPEKALEYMNAALKVDPGHAQAHWNKSLALLEMGRYKEGWPEYDWGSRAKVRLERNYTKDPLPEWDGSPGKTLVVYGEQGIGDEILFASCLPDLIKDSKQVVFDCHKKLHQLFCNSFPQIDIYPTREDDQIMWPIKQDGTQRYPFDAKIAIGSLPRFYRPTEESFPGTPFIHPTKDRESKYAEKLAALGNKPKIGISWWGGHKRTRVEVRSIDLEKLLPVLKQDATFISLQYTPVDVEVEEFEKTHGIKLHHWPECVYNEHYNDTAGLVANLDLVITVCTSLVHLAGSMGVPTWVMTPSRPAWRYKIEGESMPWYKTVTLFRQERTSTDWEPVIQEVAGALQDLLETIQQEETA